MKFHISINQQAVVEGGFTLDLVDMAILDFIKDFSHAARCRRVEIGGRTFYWISHALIIQELPIMGITTARGLRNHIDNLIKCGVLERPQAGEYDGNMTLYAFGENYEKLLFSEGGKEFPSPEKIFPPPGKNFPTPRKNFSDNNNINNINNNIESVAPHVAPREVKEIYSKMGFTPEALAREIGDPRADIAYYHAAVENWSVKKDVKRTREGWVATVRDFIRTDRERGTLHVRPLPPSPPPRSEVDEETLRAATLRRRARDREIYQRYVTSGELFLGIIEDKLIYDWLVDIQMAAPITINEHDKATAFSRLSATLEDRHARLKLSREGIDSPLVESEAYNIARLRAIRESFDAMAAQGVDIENY